MCFVRHQSCDVILDDVTWRYVIDSRKPSAWSENGVSLFELTEIFRTHDGSKGTQWASLILHPHLLGNFAWQAEQAIGREQVTPAGERSFLFHVCIPDPNMKHEANLINWRVVRGTSLVARVGVEFYPDTSQWRFQEKSGNAWVMRLLDETQTYPDWVKERLLGIYIPALEVWINDAAERKRTGRQLETHWTIHPSGNPEMSWQNRGRPQKEVAHERS